MPFGVEWCTIAMVLEKVRRMAYGDDHVHRILILRFWGHEDHLGTTCETRGIGGGCPFFVQK